MKKYSNYFTFFIGLILFISGVTVILFNGLLYGINGGSYEIFKLVGFVLVGVGLMLTSIGIYLCFLRKSTT